MREEEYFKQKRQDFKSIIEMMHRDIMRYVKQFESRYEAQQARNERQLIGMKSMIKGFQRKHDELRNAFLLLEIDPKQRAIENKVKDAEILNLDNRLSKVEEKKLRKMMNAPKECMSPDCMYKAKKFIYNERNPFVKYYFCSLHVIAVKAGSFKSKSWLVEPL